jgi:hypothetical protein
LRHYVKGRRIGKYFSYEPQGSRKTSKDECKEGYIQNDVTRTEENEQYNYLEIRLICKGNEKKRGALRGNEKREICRKKMGNEESGGRDKKRKRKIDG